MPAATARAGLLGEKYKGQEGVVHSMSDQQVLDEYKAASLELWRELGDSPEQWDGKLAEAEELANSSQQALAPQARANRSRRNSIAANLTSDEALKGFLREIEMIPPHEVRQGLLEGDSSRTEAEVDAMSDTEVSWATILPVFECWSTGVGRVQEAEPAGVEQSGQPRGGPC